MNIKPWKSRLLLHSRETLVEEKSRDFQENVLACLGFGWGDADVSATRLNDFLAATRSSFNECFLM